MTVKRIVANLAAVSISETVAFYKDLLELDILMDQGWISTLGSSQASATPQISIATEGGSGTQVSNLSIEVDNLDEVYQRALAGGFNVTYELTEEPWGVRRFYVEDPLGNVVNILDHAEQ